MDSLRKFRKETALSQYMMAEFLRTSRSQVKLGEQGERPLPEITWQRLKAWEDLPHSKRSTVDNEISLFIKEKEEDALDKRQQSRIKQHKKNQAKHYLFSKRRTKMEASIAKNKILVQSLSNALIVLRDTNAAPAEIANFELHRSNAVGAILRNHFAMLQIQDEIEILEAEAVVLERLSSASHL